MSLALAARPGLEVAQRIERLLDLLDRPPSPDRLRDLRAVEALEHINTAAARDFLRHLAGAPTAPG
jgi:hypothetical protein